MNVLVTGRPNNGSWQIRGVQLGHAIGATVIPDATKQDIAAADLVIMVKKPSKGLVERIWASGRPFVYDTVDPWPQPAMSAFAQTESIAWLRSHVAALRPMAVVTATRCMQIDLDFNGPVLALRHHSRPGLAINPIREEIRTVGYEGDVRQLGEWRDILERQCTAHGWKFVENPETLWALDIAVALRGREWNGWAPQMWKSNVKLANCQASGTPCIMSASAGYAETAFGGVFYASDETSLEKAFACLHDQHGRQWASRALRSSAPHVSIETVAREYKQWLQSLVA